jgi:hypothetical protein
MPELPDYERPPAVEVVAAVQFLPLPQFGMREARRGLISRALHGWHVVGGHCPQVHGRDH